VEAVLSCTLQIAFITPFFFRLYTELKKPDLDIASSLQMERHRDHRLHVCVMGQAFPSKLDRTALPTNLQNCFAHRFSEFNFGYTFRGGV